MECLKSLFKKKHNENIRIRRIQILPEYHRLYYNLFFNRL